MARRVWRWLCVLALVGILGPSHASELTVSQQLDEQAKKLNALLQPSMEDHNYLQSLLKHDKLEETARKIEKDKKKTSGSRPQFGDLANALRYKSVVMGLQDSPFFNERYRREFEAWRDSIMYMQMKMRPDFETTAAFVPGVGYLRPFIRYPNFIPNQLPPAKVPEKPDISALLQAAQQAKELLSSKPAVEEAPPTNADAQANPEDAQNNPNAAAAETPTDIPASAEEELPAAPPNEFVSSLSEDKYPSSEIDEETRQKLSQWASSSQ